ncbi:ABC transporter, ATP-binding protein [Lachnospiraceae bacterium KM106-2]|nr:ABC transporter, ATP-binding protein [Lachnospiraceae bacterium KM106-2]
MKEYLKRRFALSEKGAKDLIRAIIACTLTNLSFMFPVGLIYFALQGMLGKYVGTNDQAWPVIYYIGISIVLLAIIYICEYHQYNATFLAAYEESASKRIHLAEKLRVIPLSFFGKKNVADLTSTIMSDCSGMETAFSHFIPQLCGAILSLVFVGIGLLIFEPRLALSLLWVVPVAFMITILGKRQQNRMNLKNDQSKLACADTIQECIENVREIKANNQEVRYLAKVDEKIDELEKISLRSELNTAVFVVPSQMLLKVGITTLALMGSYLIGKNEVDVLTLLMFLIAASRVFDPLAISLQNLAAIYATELKVARMNEIENQEIQTGSDEMNVRDYDIEFKHVKFAYKKDEPVLKDVNFVAKQGEVTALVGPSGGGKSTISKLAARFWDVNGGQIKIGGFNVASMEAEALLKNFSIVFQDVVLFNNTIMENIRLGRKDATDKEVIEAAKMACCDEFIRKQPQGYETMIGENGSLLSGGERQRISIARAILKDAPIILLDEATASLDVENESKVQEAISRLVRNKTVLVIAHRMRTIASADHIVVLADGKVKEEGDHDSLLKKKGLYHKLWTLQTQASNWSLSA